MDYAARAEDVGLTGRICKVCGSEVGADQEIAYDIHDAHSATVRCWGCHESILEGQARVCLDLMNIFQHLGATTSAAVVFGHLRKIDRALEHEAAA